MKGNLSYDVFQAFENKYSHRYENREPTCHESTKCLLVDGAMAHQAVQLSD